MSGVHDLNRCSFTCEQGRALKCVTFFSEKVCVNDANLRRHLRWDPRVSVKCNDFLEGAVIDA